MIKKILLVNPPNTMPADSVRRISEPLGLLYVGAMLRENGYEATVFDMACEGYDNCEVMDGYVTYGSSQDELKRKIRDLKPDIVGVSCLFTAREENSLKACRTIRDADKSIPIVMGGLHPSLFPERFLEGDHADYIIFGEGEFRMLKLLDCMDRAKEPDFDGVAFKTKNSFKVNEMASWIDNLDSIPYPDRSMVDMERYIAIGVPFAPFSYKQRVAQVLTTRGCPQNCIFCSSVNYWGRKIRKRSVENIIGEIKTLIDRYGIEEIQFADDNMTADKAFAKELFIRLKVFGLKWCTPNGLMLNTLDKEMIKLMAESGAYQLSFAIESASERVLKEIIKKRVDLDLAKQLVEEAHKYDVSIHAMFVSGFPGETREEILKTLVFPFEAGFDSVSFFIANPLPGSRLYDICKKKRYLVENYRAMDFKTSNIRIPRDSADYTIDPVELVELIDVKTKEFNEWTRKQYPDRWKRKFDRYLKNRPQDNKVIMGRVT